MLYEQIQEALTHLRRQTAMAPQTGIILGTGLSGLADEIETEVEVKYGDIPHFPESTVEGHAGKLIFGKLDGVPVVAMAGRFHYYEGYSMKQVTFPVRVMRALGVERLIVSNAAGGTQAHIRAGDLVFIHDHINMHPENPLRGPNDERLGVRFPDLLHTYDKTMLVWAVKFAEQNHIRAHRGVYVALPGPNLETPAEYRFIHRIGGDVVGMSTVPEVLMARHAGMKIFVVSVVSNQCFPIEDLTETTLEEVIEVVGKATPNVVRLVRGLVAK